LRFIPAQGHTYGVRPYSHAHRVRDPDAHRGGAADAHADLRGAADPDDLRGLCALDVQRAYTDAYALGYSDGWQDALSRLRADAARGTDTPPDAG
jgi:hypothetical protein